MNLPITGTPALWLAVLVGVCFGVLLHRGRVNDVKSGSRCWKSRGDARRLGPRFRVRGWRAARIGAMWIGPPTHTRDDEQSRQRETGSPGNRSIVPRSPQLTSAITAQTHESMWIVPVAILTR